MMETNTTRYADPTYASLKITGILVDRLVEEGRSVNDVLAEGRASGGSGEFYYDQAILRDFSDAVSKRFAA